MSNKQSSVEYYIDKLGYILGDEICNKLTIEQTNKIHFLVKQAKAMHKEEIKEAIMFGDCRGQISTYATSEEYYNETFGGNNE